MTSVKNDPNNLLKTTDMFWQDCENGREINIIKFGGKEKLWLKDER